MKRILFGAAALAALVLSTVGTPTPSPAGAVSSGYVSLDAPARILDTRSDGNTVDGQFARLGLQMPGSTLALTVGGRASVPTDASSVVLNVTAAETGGSGFVTVYPCGAGRPTASSLNFVAGVNIPNLVIARPGSGAQVCLFTSATTHLVIDITGYFSGTDGLAPLAAPARLLDTRSDGVTVDGQAMQGGMVAAGTLELQVGGRANVPVGSAAVVLNVTVDQPAVPGFITVYPCDASRPTASNVNYAAGQTVPNAVISRLDSSGRVCLFASSAVHLVVDASGYFADVTLLSPLASPGRLLDTRTDGRTIDGAFVGSGLRPNGGTVRLLVAGRAGVPANASAVVLNVTADQAKVAGFVTAYSTNVGRPNASNVNYVAGRTSPNAVIARLGSDGAICVFNSGSVHLVVDVAAYIVGPASSGPASCPADPPPPPPPSTTTPPATAPPATSPPATSPPATSPPATSPPNTTPPGSGTDPRFSTCTKAKAAGYGPYYRGVDPEYAWYEDRDNDGIVCE